MQNDNPIAAIARAAELLATKRLPHHVTDEDHPFHALFEDEKAPQIFFATRDGSFVRGFDHRKSRQDLDDVMLEVLEQTYAKKPARQCSELVKMLPATDRRVLQS